MFIGEVSSLGRFENTQRFRPTPCNITRRTVVMYVFSPARSRPPCLTHEIHRNILLFVFPSSPFTTTNLCSLVAEVATALAHLHSANFVHNDVKAENVLVFSDGPGTSPTAKLTDFGLATGEQSIFTVLCALCFCFPDGFARGTRERERKVGREEGRKRGTVYERCT